MTFPRVPEIAPGEVLSSRHVAALADAINARIRSGLGDAAFRIAFWWLSAFRQLRNPDASRNLWPSSAEFFEAYQALNADVDFPVTGPGDPEGVNLASLLPWYVYGSDASGKASEADRLTDPETGGLDVREVATGAEAWELGKRQRGAIVPATGASNAPAFEAAREVFSFVHPGITPHGKAWGGLVPTPEYLGPCNPPGGSQATPLSYAIRFTRLSDNHVVTYPGTCPEEPTHVAYVLDYPLEWYVVKYSGAVDWYPKSLWVQGPYTGGGKLAKTEGDHVARVVNRFCGEFRGTEERIKSEHEGRASYLGAAFSVAEFMRRPYYLAPARALMANADTLTPVYPGGSAFAFGPGQDIGAHVAEDRFWFSAAYVEGDPGTVVEFRGPDGESLGVGTVPASGGAVVTFSAGAASITVRAVSSAQTVRWELAETLAYRPAVHDLFLVLRIAGARTSDGNGTDGSGLTEDRAAQLWAAYKANGCIPMIREDGFLAGSLETINRNAVFDAARRYSRAVRLLRRQQIVGYGVEGGRSVLYVDPLAFGMSGADLLAGIRDAIAHDAEATGWTNEWVAFWQFKAYHPSGSSIWKPEAYSDFFALSDRCVFAANPLSTGDDLKTHFNAATPEDSNLSVAPEVAPGFRYATTAAGSSVNASPTVSFYRSCQIYPAPYEIERADTVLWRGAEVVRIEFTGRFQSHPSAPASIDPEISTWDPSAVTAEAEDYRTDENAIRDYLLHVANGSHQCEATGAGNTASSTWLGGGDDPLGTCYPHLWLVQLVPRPYADGNERQDRTDTPVTHDQFAFMESYIRVMCEGNVDGRTSTDHGCAEGIQAVYDFTFPTLCFQAFGLSSMGTMPGTVTDYLGPGDVREDNPVGYGPLPTVRMAAETYNRFASAVNLMTRYRVMLPMSFSGTAYEDSGPTRAVGARYAGGAAVDCTAIGTNGFLWEGSGWRHTPTTVLGAMGPDAVGQLTIGFANSPTYSANCIGTSMAAQVRAHEDAYAFEPTDPDALEAIPAAWRGELATEGEMLASVEDTVRVTTYTIDTPATACAGATWDTGAGELVISVEDVTETRCELVASTGRAVADDLGFVRIFGADAVGQCDSALYSVGSSLRTITPVPTNTLIYSVPLEDTEAGA